MGGSGTCKALILRESLLNSSQQRPIVGNLNNLRSDLSTADIHGGIIEHTKLALNGSNGLISSTMHNFKTVYGELP